MNDPQDIVISRHSFTHASLRNYVRGFVGSLVLTLTAFCLVYYHVFNSQVALIGSIVILALSQLILQLVFFLHLGAEPKPRWKLMIFIVMITIMLIIVGGSLWIMSNLNHMHTSLSAMKQYMYDQNGL